MDREREFATEAEVTLRQPPDEAPPCPVAESAVAEATLADPVAPDSPPPLAPVSNSLAVTAAATDIEPVSHDTTESPTDMATQAPTLHPEGPSGSSSPSDGGSIPSLDSLSTDEWDKLPPPVFEVGRVVFGKYRLHEKIGMGGMGEVWRVTHLHLEAERALKLIRPEFVQSGKGWRRFRREAQLMAKIDHPHAVAVYDFKRANSMGYIEMELVRGRSLKEILDADKGAPMPLERVREIVDQLCDVLAAAHEHTDERTGKSKPIIHRDLKPSNLMLIERKDREGETRLKVLDFGIAKMIEDDGAVELTGAGDLVGTPAYMSPEQIRGGFDRDNATRPVEARSDLYSAGVVLYHLLTGSPPFHGNKMTVLAAHLNSIPRAFAQVNPALAIPAAVERVVSQCLEKDPDLRPSTARELKELFRQAATVRVDPAVEVAHEPVAVVPPARRLGTLAAAVAALAVIGGGLLAVFRDRSPRPPLAPSELVAITPKATPTKATGSLSIPEGYVALDPEQLAPDNPAYPSHIRRSNDGVAFTYYQAGLYLPDGYAPDAASRDDLVGSWPRVIVRSRDGVRFIRIAGGVFRRGDSRAGGPAVDPYNNPFTPHYVSIPGYYIQESEVTNGEIEYYHDNVRRDDDALMAAWKRTFDGLVKEYGIKLEKARHYPAVGVDARVARRYAASVGGLLPTESEFEYAAKSCRSDFFFPWGAKAPGPGDPSLANLESENPNVLPVEVKTSGDRTEQGVFDLAGNVRELCAEVYSPYSRFDPLKHDATERALVIRREETAFPDDPNANVVVRGGSFLQASSRAYAFYRSREPAGSIPGDVGFRVVIECPEPPRLDESSL